MTEVQQIFIGKGHRPSRPRQPIAVHQAAPRHPRKGVQPTAHKWVHCRPDVGFDSGVGQTATKKWWKRTAGRDRPLPVKCQKICFHCSTRTWASRRMNLTSELDTSATHTDSPPPPRWPVIYLTRSIYINKQFLFVWTCHISGHRSGVSGIKRTNYSVVKRTRLPDTLDNNAYHRL